VRDLFDTIDRADPLVLIGGALLLILALEAFVRIRRAIVYAKAAAYLQGYRLGARHAREGFVVVISVDDQATPVLRIVAEKVAALR
jgi:hypothetical protein